MQFKQFPNSFSETWNLTADTSGQYTTILFAVIQSVPFLELFRHVESNNKQIIF